MSVAIDYQPPDKTLSEFCLAPPGRSAIVVGSVGSGKTTAVILRLMSLVNTFPVSTDGERHVKILVIMATTAKLKSTVLSELRNMLGGSVLINQAPPITAKYQQDCPDGIKARVEMILLHGNKDKDAERLRSLQASFVWLSEARDISPVVCELALSRAGRFPAKATLKNPEEAWNPFAIIDTNAPSCDTYLEAMMNGQVSGYTPYIQAPAVLEENGKYVVNPDAPNAMNLPDGYYDALLSNGDEFIRTNLMNIPQPARYGRVIFPEFIRAEHTRKVQLNRNSIMVGGADFGLVFTGFLLAQFNAAAGQIEIIGEFPLTDMGAKQTAEVMLTALQGYGKKVKDVRFYVDPAGSQRSQADSTVTAIGELHKAGIQATPTRTNLFHERRECLAQLLQKRIGRVPKLIIDEGCTELIKALESRHVYEERADGDRVVMPRKDRWSTMPDALGYLAMGIEAGANKAQGGAAASTPAIQRQRFQR